MYNTYLKFSEGTRFFSEQHAGTLQWNIPSATMTWVLACVDMLLA